MDMTILKVHQIPQMPSILSVLITEPGPFQPALATVRRIAQDPIWRMKSQSHLQLHHLNRFESHETEYGEEYNCL